jgi:hypothetical protein
MISDVFAFQKILLERDQKIVHLDEKIKILEEQIEWFKRRKRQASPYFFKGIYFLR